MPRMTGLQAAREIRAHAPDTRVLMLSMHDDERYFLEGLEAGAAGYVLKRAADKDLIDAVRTVADGRTFLSDDAQRDADGRVARGRLDRAWTTPLTPRELEVVKLIAEAYTNKQIAETLKLSEKTVESHRTNVFGEARHARPRGDRALRDPARARRAVGLRRRSRLRPVVVLARAVEEERDGEQHDRQVDAQHQPARDLLVRRAA